MTAVIEVLAEPPMVRFLAPVILPLIVSVSASLLMRDAVAKVIAP